MSPSVPTESSAADNERTAFLILIAKALRFGEARVQAPSPGQARRIRRRFYHLRETLSGSELENANKCSFRLNGSIIVVEPALSNWSAGVTPDAPTAQPKPTSGN